MVRVGPRVLAHRGANRREPENSLAAFDVALALGADGVETDVRRSADGVLLLHHDAERDGIGVLGQVPFARIRAEAPEVPTLDEGLSVLFADGRRPVVNLELKCLPWEPDADADGSVAAALVDAVRAWGVADDVIVSSFDLLGVTALHERAPEIATAWLTTSPDLAEATRLAATAGHRYLHPFGPRVFEFGADEAVAAARAAGLGVNVWTVNDEAEIDALLDAGVDAIVTDLPDVACARRAARHD
jgi:glycerophosphoryl diester phosphodiesterase